MERSCLTTAKFLSTKKVKNFWLLVRCSSARQIKLPQNYKLNSTPKLIIEIGIGKVGKVQMIGIFRSCRRTIPVISSPFLPFNLSSNSLTTPLMASSSSNTGGPSPLRLKVVVVGGGIAGDYLYSMGRVIFCVYQMFKGSQLLLRSRGLVTALSFWRNGMKRQWFVFCLLVIQLLNTHSSLQSFGEAGGIIR